MFFQLQIVFLFWLYWLCLFCCTTIRHYKFILIIPLTTENEKSYYYVLLRIYLIMKNVCCSGRRRRCWLLFQSWVHEEITWILYWFKITLLKHMLTMILQINKKENIYVSYFTIWTIMNDIWRYLFLCPNIKRYSFTILFRTVWYPKYCQHHTLNVYYSYHKCANKIWHYLFERLNILRFIIFGYKPI